MTKKIIAILSISILIITAAVFTLKHFKSDNNKHFENDGDKVTVSILPIKYLIDNISGNKFQVNVLVPPGTSPETYEPTPQQIINLNKSKAIFTIGLIDFETTLINKVQENSKSAIHHLYEGMNTLEGHCSHKHHHSGHRHGIDPHIWTSVSGIKVMSNNVLNALTLLYPNDSAAFRLNYDNLMEEIEQLDLQIRELIQIADINSFLIYHPVLTYYAGDYGLHQVALEQDGKEPSLNHIKSVIDNAIECNTKVVLYQKEFPRSVVETVAKDIGAEPVEIDPLAENILDNIMLITKTITHSN